MNDNNHYPLSDLPQRYGITASAIKSRRDYLNITSHRVGKKFFISNEDLRRLDKLHEFLLTGAKLKDYVELGTTELVSTLDNIDFKETDMEKSVIISESETVMDEMLDERDDSISLSEHDCDIESLSEDSTKQNVTKTLPPNNPPDNSSPPAAFIDEKALKNLNKSKFFQAIGYLQGEVREEAPTIFYINLSGYDYKLFIPREERRFTFLNDIKVYNNYYLEVYPRSLILPDGKFELFFELVAWNKLPFTDNDGEPYEPYQFFLRGIWQFISMFRAPIISIYRNKVGKKTDEHRYKANHLPVLMKRDDCTPFRFNPRGDKNSTPPKYFINAVFKFLPAKCTFAWQKDIQPPTTRIPRYHQPVKYAEFKKIQKEKKVQNSTL